MFRPSHFAALAAAVVSFASSFTLATDYSESVSGDLSGIGVLTNIVLTPGDNLITGSIALNTSPFLFETDSFAFTVPAGMTLTGGSVSMSDLTGNITAATWSLFKGSATAGSGTNLELLFPTSPGSDSISTLRLAADVYNFTQGQVDIASGSSNNSANYTFTLTVAVPEPASLSILGLSGLLLRRRRK